MSFIDPSLARQIYENNMKTKLYETVKDNSNLKDYVDSLYLRERNLSLFIGFEIVFFAALAFIFIIYPYLSNLVVV
jgi:hypothetical protein